MSDQLNYTVLKKKDSKAANTKKYQERKRMVKLYGKKEKRKEKPVTPPQSEPAFSFPSTLT